MDATSRNELAQQRLSRLGDDASPFVTLDDLLEDSARETWEVLTSRRRARTRMRMERRPLTAIHIDCSSATHTLAVGPRGRLQARDHPEESRAAEEALTSLGGSKPTCLRIIEELQSRSELHFWPKEWRFAETEPWFKDAHAVQLMRQTERNLDRDRLKEAQENQSLGGQACGWLRERLREKLREKLEASFIQCREAYANAPGGKNLIDIPFFTNVRAPEDNRGPSIRIRPSEDYDFVSTETCLEIVVLWRWCRLVVSGLAVVQHHLILDLLEPGDSPLVLAVVSRRDGSLVLEESRLTPADGKWGFASRHSGCGACM